MTPQQPENSSPFPELEHARPLLQSRVEDYRDELCQQMLQCIDRIQDLEKRLQSEAGIQEQIDARLNSMAYREAAEAMIGADTALALAARRMSFHQ